MLLSELRLIKDEIINKYINEKLSTYEIANLYGCFSSSIVNLLKENNIERRNYKEAASKKYKLNENFFDIIDTEEKAYTLGFFFADGYNNRKSRQVVFHLAKEDEEILKKFQKVFETDSPIKIRKEKKLKTGYQPQDTVTLCLFSTHMCEELIKIGAPPSKTFSITFPDWIRDDLKHHFIRGYFDGDGCVYKHCGKYLYWNITSNEEFCKGLKKELDKNNIPSSLNSNDKHTNIKIKKLVNQNIKGTKIFLDYIYKDATIYLDRKYKIYTEYFYKNNIT